MTSDTVSDRLDAVGKIGAGAALAGVLLLLAPWTPPQVALFAFVALFVLGVVLYFGVSYIVGELSSGWEAAEPEGEDEQPEELTDLQERYLNDPSFDEADYERAVEAALANGDIAEEKLPDGHRPPGDPVEGETADVGNDGPGSGAGEN